MNKLLLLSTLIAILPFTANASNRIGPANIDTEDAVYSDYPGPYETAEILPGDATQVVSASYIKGAYNDTIAAINTVVEAVDEKQSQLQNINGTPMSSTVVGTGYFVTGLNSNDLSDNDLASAAATAAGIKSQRVTAVDTWGSNHTVDLGLKTAAQ